MDDDAYDKFKPLPDEILDGASATTGGKPARDDGDLISPVPPDAPKPPRKHPRWGEPTAHWIYRDANGATLQIIYRFDPPGDRKQLVPCTLWRDGKGLRWRWKALPVQRPLYGVDRLAANPDGMIIVCEGEKAADAAALIFPDQVAITSPGGAQAAEKANWDPLAGRGVLIWPDADEAGKKYAVEVARILSARGCEVSVIDAMELAAIDPFGTKREPEKGWDAADASGEWRDYSALRAAALSHAEAFGPNPAFVSHGPFEMRENGLWMRVEDKGSNGEHGDGAKKEIWLSGPFEIPGRIRDAHGGQWARQLRWRDEDGREHDASVNDADLHGEAAALAGTLAQGGLRIATGRGNREKLVAYLNGAIVTARITTVERTGWHQIGVGAVYVLPDQSIGAPASEAVALRGRATAEYGRRGTLKSWQESVGKRIAGHSRAMLAVSVAFIGPLLYLTGQDGFGVNIFLAPRREVRRPYSLPRRAYGDPRRSSKHGGQLSTPWKHLRRSRPMLSFALTRLALWMRERLVPPFTRSLTAKGKVGPTAKAS